ncbi:MAG: DUF512 domain-containing protein [Firmicutes bacterium]|nr:DUF512 domain-containing protein [Bacillota bacterium]
MKNKGLIIATVEPGSIAAELELRPGDRVVEMNGRPVRDMIDYRFLESDEELTIRVEKAGGEEWLIDLEKDFDEGLGLDFGENACGRTIRCSNKCVFCFVDQMPPGLRKTLYVKDDDYRLSFLSGNFITLTNIKEDDFRRIAQQRLSPLYISVHATSPALREKLLGNKRAGQIKKQLQRLAGAGIEMHTQAVLCPGFNDGPELARTFADLAGLWPAVRSLAVVPVGLTRFREHCYALKPFVREGARAVLRFVREKQEQCLARFGYPFIFASDEFYFLAGEDIPPSPVYADYPQVENGVGITRLFLDQWRETGSRLPPAAPRPVEAAVVTGTLAAPVLGPVVDRLCGVAGLDVELLVVKNRFFGEQVTVAGLVAGGDIAEQAGAGRHRRLIILPSVMLKKDEAVFLDDMTLPGLAERLKTNIAVVDGPGQLVQTLLQGPEKAALFHLYK